MNIKRQNTLISWLEHTCLVLVLVLAYHTHVSANMFVLFVWEVAAKSQDSRGAFVFRSVNVCVRWNPYRELVCLRGFAQRAMCYHGDGMEAGGGGGEGGGAWRTRCYLNKKLNENLFFLFLFKLKTEASYFIFPSQQMFCCVRFKLDFNCFFSHQIATAKMQIWQNNGFSRDCI